MYLVNKKLEAVGPVAGAALGVDHGNDVNLVLPVKKDDEVRKILEQDSARTV